MFGVSIWICDNKIVSTEPYQLYRRFDSRWQTLDASVVVPGIGLYRVHPERTTCRADLEQIQVFDDEKELVVFVADSFADCQAYLWGFNVGSKAMRVICHDHYNSTVNSSN